MQFHFSIDLNIFLCGIFFCFGWFLFISISSSSFHLSSYFTLSVLIFFSSSSLFISGMSLSFPNRKFTFAHLNVRSFRISKKNWSTDRANQRKNTAANYFTFLFSFLFFFLLSKVKEFDRKIAVKNTKIEIWKRFTHRNE